MTKIEGGGRNLRRRRKERTMVALLVFILAGDSIWSFKNPARE